MSREDGHWLLSVKDKHYIACRKEDFKEQKVFILRGELPETCPKCGKAWRIAK